MIKNEHYVEPLHRVNHQYLRNDKFGWRVSGAKKVFWYVILTVIMVPGLAGVDTVDNIPDDGARKKVFMSDYIVQGRTGEAIQAAIDLAHQAGGGRVCLEPGTYLSGTIHLKSNVELHLPAGAKLKGYSDPERYEDFSDPDLGGLAPEKSRKCLIVAAHAENIAITGRGEINGSGPDFYDHSTAKSDSAFWAKPAHPRPRMIQFLDCRNVLFEGVSFVDSPVWTFWLIGCEDVQITRIRITGCQQMINNDGIDIDDCRRVTVSDSFFRTGDDCIILRAHRRLPGQQAICEDVVVTNCVLNSRCQGIRIGCPSDDTIRRCTFSNITFKGSGNSININNPVRYLGKGSTGYLDLRDLVFSNFVIESERVPVWINVEETVRLRHLGDMTFTNFRIKAKDPIRLEGSTETTISDIRFNEIVCESTTSQAIVANRVTRLSLNQVTVSSNQEVKASNP